ncbi:MAG: undecaprenyl/decaprenyl-phosphate alpha-N-acetylglucosaminyl 1-phosphate transferase [Thermoleophilaceae bacterium]|nr:undecaprenyl/decaprenyl-phosphate alpha-N-acetylglucosaminyl 1-phosphate transferase [Thermoleophilaceae bacterium]
MDNLDALWAFLVSAAVALVATPLAARFAHRVGAIDQPSERGLHDEPTPRLGGLAILAAVLASSAIFLPIEDEVRGVLAGAVVVALVGALDDIYDLNPFVKLAGQVIGASIPVAAGVWVDASTIPFLGRVEFGEAGRVLTAVGIVAVINIVNFTDGVDGLAAGVCTISAATLAAIALSLDRTDAGILAAITAGAAIGFLRHNFHPASVFMGDAGSNLLGFLLACIAVQGALKTAAVAALVFPLVILAVPIIDTSFVVLKRIKYRQPVYRPDSEHLHHRFARIGFSQRRTVLYLYGWTLTLAGFALAIRFVPYSDGRGNFDTGYTIVMFALAALVFAASLYLVYVLEIFKFRRFRERQLRKPTVGGEPALSQDEIDEEIAREVETGEWDAVKGPG